MTPESYTAPDRAQGLLPTSHGVKPQYITTSSYHLAQADIDDAIQELLLHSAALTNDHRRQLTRIIERSDGLDKQYGIDEVHQQYRLVEKIRTQVVSDDGMILPDTTVKDLSALIGALNSLISVYIRSEQKLNKLQEEANLREAVLEALKELPPEAREVFFKKLDGFQTKKD